MDFGYKSPDERFKSKKLYGFAVKLTPDDLKAQFRQTASRKHRILSLSWNTLQKVKKNIDVDEKELEEKLQEYAKLGNKTLEEYLGGIKNLKK